LYGIDIFIHPITGGLRLAVDCMMLERVVWMNLKIVFLGRILIGKHSAALTQKIISKSKRKKSCMTLFFLSVE
jgi:hypothetical protein